LGILIFAFVLSVLIVFHEWGHYFIAKCCGIRVERFSIGFGPQLLKLKPRETEFCVSLIPLGGYVKLAGEDPKDSKGESWEYSAKPRWQKFSVVLAGPLLNAILAFVLFTLVYVAGQPVLTSKIGEVMEGFPAHEAGLLHGDRITGINERPVQLWEELLVAIHQNKSDKLLVSIERAGEFMSLDLSPRMEKTKDIFGKERNVPRIGVTPFGETTHQKAAFFEGIQLAIHKVIMLTKLILMALGMLVTGAISFKDSMAGPIQIYMMTQQAAQVGWVQLFDFMGRLSVSLFVINLMPIPVLDGGHLFFYIIESIIRRPVSNRIKEVSTQVGMVLILMLTAYVIYQDSIKFGIMDKMKALIGL